MKYFKVVLLSMLLIVFVIGMFSLSVGGNEGAIQNSDYLRLHIRANSNSNSDQNIKYEIKNEILTLITKDVANIKTKIELADYFTQNKSKLENFVNKILQKNGFNYISNITVRNE